MKKSIYFSITLLCVFTVRTAFAQIAGFTVSPAQQCYSSSGNTASAGMQAQVPSATTYSWVIISPNSSCPASFSTAATATGTPSNSLINITFNCCGIYTITNFSYNTLVNPPVLVAAITQTAAITCPSSTVSVAGNTTICLGTSSILQASGANSFTWQPGSISGSSISVTPSVNTCYTVIGASSNSCSSSQSICVTVSPCTGIEKQGQELGIKFYPNPILDLLHLHSLNSSTVTYKIYDLLGREILNGEFVNSKTLDLSNYSNGTYVIKLESQGTSIFKKLVVEK